MDNYQYTRLEATMRKLERSIKDLTSAIERANTYIVMLTKEISETNEQAELEGELLEMLESDMTAELEEDLNRPISNRLRLKDQKS